MVEVFRDRFQLMEESGQLSAPVRALTEELLRKVEREIGIELTEESGGMAATHLALALERIARREPLEAIPEDIVAEGRQCIDEWRLAEAISREAARVLDEGLPDGELGFLAIHFRAVKLGAADAAQG